MGGKKNQTPNKKWSYCLEHVACVLSLSDKIQPPPENDVVMLHTSGYGIHNKEKNGTPV